MYNVGPLSYRGNAIYLESTVFSPSHFKIENCLGTRNSIAAERRSLFVSSICVHVSVLLLNSAFLLQGCCNQLNTRACTCVCVDTRPAVDVLRYELHCSPSVHGECTLKKVVA